MLVLIVKEDSDVYTKSAHRMKTCLQNVHPHIPIHHLNLTDSNSKQLRNRCDKVIFLLSNQHESAEIAKREWIGKLPKVQNDKSNVIIIKLNKFNASKQEGNEDSELDQNNMILISNFESDIFKWWPQVLVFLFGKQSVGSLFNKAYVPNQNKFCVHCFPNREETAHPITKEMFEMLQSFGARGVEHHEGKQCCILLCRDASMRLPWGIQLMLKNTSRNVPVFGVTLSGTTFSDEITTHTDRRFTRAQLMSLILVLLTELNLLNAKLKHSPATRRRFSPLFLYLAALSVFTFNIPALLIQMAACMVFPWPLLVNYLVQDEQKKVKFLNYGLAISSTAVIVVLIILEALLFPEFFRLPISVPVSIYLFIWQIGVGLNLHAAYDFKYGIYSIPSNMLKGLKSSKCL